jgi:L-threonylcarbamoyladenylate synthase
MGLRPEELRGGSVPQGGSKTERLQSAGVTGARAVARAADILRAGGTVAFPTETVYGLGANALDPAAVAAIFTAKQRPAWDPLIVHIDSAAMLPQVASIPAPRSARIAALMQAFWPGPLTLLLPRAAGIPDAVTAGRALVGVRMPAHPVALDLIRQAGVPIAAPSANLFSRPSPTAVAHVLQDLDGRIDAVLDGGPTRVGVESTVIGPDPGDPHGFLVYRPGAVSLDMLRAVCRAVPAPRPGSPSAPAALLPSPGMGIRHYAPRARLMLVRGIAASGRPLEQALMPAIDEAATIDANIGVMLPDGWNASSATAVFRWGPWHDAELLSRLLFAGLRLLDERGVRVIVCPVPEMGGLGEALRDRLEKAARTE